jgi:hypothetical protein
VKLYLAMVAKGVGFEKDNPTSIDRETIGIERYPN